MGRGTVGGILPQGFTLGYFRFLPTGEVTSELQGADLDERRRGVDQRSCRNLSEEFLSNAAARREWCAQLR